MSAGAPPLLPTVGVLALVPDTWGSRWQARHHVLTRLARYFRVVWVDPPCDWRHVLIGDPGENTEALSSPPPPGLLVYRSEPWLPQLYRPRWLAEWTSRFRLDRARNLLVREGCREFVLYIWRPELGDALNRLPFDLSCYHIDDEYSFSSVEVPPSEEERCLLAAVNQVFINSPGLLEKKGTVNPHTLFVPNGVNYRAFSQPSPEPRDLVRIPNPRVGYAGYLKKQLDWPLLLELTARHLDWSFVFVGALVRQSGVAEAVERLAGRGNVHFLGAKSTEALTAYPGYFDVCIMPYRADDYTRYIYPLKLHEYLATGLPTVGTRIRSLEEFADVVSLAETLDDWSAAIATALGPAANTPERRAKRQAVAYRHDWEALVQRIARTIVLRLNSNELTSGPLRKRGSR